MPLPEHALTVHGGCNCGAIRYKVEIPVLGDRPHHPGSDAKSAGGDVRLPFVTIDHCNDCRKATGALLPLWLCTPIANVSASALPRSEPGSGESEQSQNSSSQAGNESWRPAAEVFQPGPHGKDTTYLAFYRSLDAVTRSFCGRCGTHLGYRHDGFTAMGFPDMLDIMLGSVDRKDLDADHLAPERHLWVGCGMGWVNELASRGSGGLPKHPAFKVDEVVE